MNSVKVLGLVILAGILVILLTSCEWPPELGARELGVEVVQQTSDTAFVTATWKPPLNVQSGWELFYEWTNTRVSGGNACELSEATTQATVSFTCTKGTTAGQMRFEVTAVRVVDGSQLPGPPTSATYTVPPRAAEPPGPVDSLAVQVAWRRIWTDPGDQQHAHLQYGLPPATYREINYPQGLQESFMYEVLLDGELTTYKYDASYGVAECDFAGSQEVCPVRPFRRERGHLGLLGPHRGDGLAGVLRRGSPV
jgi:hypothetical protein